MQSRLPASSRASSAASAPPASTTDVLEEQLRLQVERLFAQALDAEADAYVSGLSDLRSEDGRRLVVRNGYLPERSIRCGVGVLRVRQPRVHDHRETPNGQHIRFASEILPAYARSTTAIRRPDPGLFFEAATRADWTHPLIEVLGGRVDALPDEVLANLRKTWERDARERKLRPLTAPAGSDRPNRAYWAAEAPIPDPRSPGYRSALVLVAEVAPEEREVVEVGLGVTGDDQGWLDLFLDLRRRGLELRPECLAPDSAPGALRALGRIVERLRERPQQRPSQQPGERAGGERRAQSG